MTVHKKLSPPALPTHSAPKQMHWGIGVLFSLALPALNITINSQHKALYDIERILTNASVTFIFLLCSWALNAHLNHSYAPDSSLRGRLLKSIIVAGANLLLLAIFLFTGTAIIQNWSSPLRVIYWLVAIKALVSVILIYIIQYALIASSKAQQTQLAIEKLKTENIQSQYEILRQQINPHFLFNTLSALRSMIRSNHPNSETFVIKLSDMYRSMLIKRQTETSSLNEEIAHISDYCFLLQARFGHSLSLTTDITAHCKNRQLPTFSLQLLVENCIKHNQISSNTPLHIRVHTPNDNCVCVTNNLNPKLTKESRSGYGLVNLTERYRLLSHHDGVSIVQSASLFEVCIKLL